MSARQFRRSAERREADADRRRRRIIAGTGGAAAALGTAVLFAPSADAATFTVTNLNSDGAGSLRQAVIDANAAGGADTIVFQSGLSGTITLATPGEIDITDPVTIQGPGASQLAVSGNDLYRIFYASGAGDVSISGLTLRNGYVSTDNGGALYSDSATNMTVNAMVFTDSYAGNGASGDGGAIQFDGPLTVQDSSFTNNRAGGAGGALYGGTTGDTATITGSTFTGNKALGDQGGAFYQDEGDTVIRNSTFSNNSSPVETGGAIYVDDGDLTVEGSTISGNRSGDNGGGLDFESDGDLSVANSTFSGNDATGYYGGAIHTIGSGAVTIAASTISGNVAEYGGGIYLYGMNGDTKISDTTISNNAASNGGGGAWLEPENGNVSISNSTVAGNNAFYVGGVFLDNDGGGTSGPVTLSSSIIADNTQTESPPRGTLYGADLGEDTLGAGFAAAFSLIEDPSGVPIGGASTNITGVDPQLGPLADNGGPTQTFLPALTSPAVDAGIANGLTTDQRGLARTADISAVPNRAGSDGTDIGSTEIQSASCQGAFVPSKTGTDGDDTITGTDGPDALFGANGNDQINALGANDCVSGDAGNDTLTGDDAKDLLLGGDGNDGIKGGAGKDKIKGEDGKDKLNGDAGKDKVVGGAGKDKIKGGNGKDKIKGNGGKDKINSIDGKVDKVNCGGSKDKAKVDSIDKVGKNCEVVHVKKRK